MAESPVNGVGTTLASSITNVATTVSLTSATGFTNAQYHCLINDGTNYEIVLATALSGTTLTVTRAVEAYNGTTTAYAFASGSSITVVPTVASVVGLIEGQPYLTVTGVGNATTATRYVGGTSVGAPTTGTFAAGDWIVDLTGTIWVCTTAGTPGTWTSEIPNSLVNRSATATAGTGEFTIFGTSGTSGQTITLPVVAVNGSLYQIKNLSPYTVNILGGTNSISVSGTIYSASTPYTIPLNSAYTFAYSGGVWYCMVTTDINKMGGLPLGVAGGGTGLTSFGTANQVLAVNSGATALAYQNPFPSAYYTTTATLSSNTNAIYTGASAVTLTLPTAPVDGTVVTIANYSSGSASITLAPGSGDTLNAFGFTGSKTMTWNQTFAFVYQSSTTTWYGLNSNLATYIKGTLASNQGGTGLTTFTAANNAIYSTSASALTAGTLPVAAGGTGLNTLGTAGQVLTVNAGATALQYSTPSSGGLTITSALGSMPPSYYYTNVSYQSIDPVLLQYNAALVADTSTGSAAITPTKQYVYFFGVYLPSGVTVNYLTFYGFVSPSSATMYMGLYNSTTRLAQTNSFTAVRYFNQQSLTSSYTTTSAGVYYVALLVASATTVPQYTSGLSAYGNIGVFNPAAVAGTLNWNSMYISGSYTTLPSTFSGVTPTNNGLTAWVGVG